MKLLFCPSCEDAFKLHPITKNCICEKSWGRYIDNYNIVLGGIAVPFGINNTSFWLCNDKILFTFEGFFYNGDNITDEHIHYEAEEHQHEEHEDCMICAECHRCQESLDSDDICSSCRAT